MPLPFDATLKDLVQGFVHDYEVLMGLSEFAPLTPLNVDLSVVSAATDVALGHGDPPDRVVDINFQSGPDEDLEARILLYHALLYYRFRVPVHSVVVLLRPVTGHQDLTGKLRYVGRKRKGKMEFSYEVIRLWRQPVQRYLTGGLGTLPLAMLCQLTAGVAVEEGLAAVVRRIAERLEREATPEDRARLLTATYVLAGLRVSREVADSLFREVPTMQESSTYLAIVEQGEVKALQKMLLRLGRVRFGQPSEAVETSLTAIRDVARLERLTERVLSADSWQDLLQSP